MTITPRLLQELITFQAERRPLSTALASEQGNLAYGDLEERSNQLARALRASGARRGDRVCILLPKSPQAIVGILGALKADCIYVPLDVASPAARLGKILEQCEPSCILASESTRGLLDELLSLNRCREAIRVGSMGQGCLRGDNFESAFTSADLETFSSVHLDHEQDSDQPAYIMFTSGSTGAPKGVTITHANVFHFIEWAGRYFGVQPADRNSGFFPLHFDLSVYDIFGALGRGAELWLVPNYATLLPNKLAEFIRASGLTQWFSVPSALTYMSKLDVVRFDDFPALKRVLWCGEVLPTPSLRYWMQRLPGVQFTNLYGPTEATIASSYYTVPSCPKDDRAPIPIGTACDGEELAVLDATLRPVGIGEVGDLYIKGVGLSPGYWKDPANTRDVFCLDPEGSKSRPRLYRTGDLAAVAADGLIYFHGRQDSQVKSRGYRIELGEIEAALHVLDCVHESAVVDVNIGGFEGATICCAYVPQPNAPITVSLLREELGQVLPTYMLPSRWLAVETLPRNANGKIDRGILRERFRQESGQETAAIIS